MDNEDLIKNWISLQRQDFNSEEYRNLFWASEKLYDIAYNNPEKCLDIILKILDTDDSAFIMANLAAGPLEDLLLHHGELLIDRIEILADLNSTFRQLLSGVWQNDIKQEVWRRVEGIRGPKW